MPSRVYRFLADLPAYLRGRGRADACWQWIVTTNYDTMLERVFQDAGEPFHLLYYQADGRDEGRFMHRTPDGAIRVIERPDNIQRFGGPAHVLVKLDGGVAWDPHLHESVAFLPSDFYASAGRFPAVLPAALRAVLRDRALLVLGSSLREAHVERLIRWSLSGESAGTSWAVIKRYWSGLGLQIVESDLEEFMLALHAQVLRVPL